MIRTVFKKFVLYLYRSGMYLDQKANYDSYSSRYKISPSFRFNGEGIQFYGEGNIEIDSNSYIGAYSTLQAYDGYSIRIGSNCFISHNVRIYTQSFQPDQDFSQNQLNLKCGNVEIGNYVWIGANVFINPGVKIGHNSIIGANSVVNTDVEPFSIFGGVPAKFIRYKRLNENH